MLPASLLAILELSMLLLIGKLGEEGFSALKLTPFVGAILMGLIFGPGITGLFYPSPYVSDFIDLGIVFILFMAGVEEIKGSAERKRPAIMGIATFIISYALLYIIFLKIGFGPTASSILSITLGMVSAGPFSRTLQEISFGSLTEKNRSLLVEVLFIEIAAVILFAFFAIGAVSSIDSIIYGALKLLIALAIIILFGKYALSRLLKFVESKFRTWEALFTVIISIILLFGFIAELVGFNSAIAAFFLGAFSSDYITNNAYLLEKLRALTYGFFEPMFFMGLGLYFVKISPILLYFGIIAFALSIFVKTLSSTVTSRFLNAGFVKNFFAISHEGGVDGAILLTALQLGLVSSGIYSFAMLAIMLLAIMAPIGFTGRTPLAKPKSSPSAKFVTFELSKTTAEELSRVLPTVAICEDSAVEAAVKKANDLNARVLVVIDADGKPLGYANVHDLFRIVSFGQGDTQIKDTFLLPVPTVKSNETAASVLDIFKVSDAQVVAVVDDHKKLVGTILEREILRFILKEGKNG
ncbi:MAG: cation:proton antiporter [Nitrososphaerota archaeon]|jgi:Kef-type K+ transport system membrane component KefB|nr:cation:proton antiporter [Nitrososphaerota archaeon]MDG6932689.1 cation:proton antiporter [Nitrososphaerota archaeon]MDG6935525.1 cation:proton antiporter [Nitrososphaerota archaeon]